MAKNHESDGLQMASRAGIFAESTQEGVSSGCASVSVCINKVRKADFWPRSTVRRPLAAPKAIFTLAHTEISIQSQCNDSEMHRVCQAVHIRIIN